MNDANWFEVNNHDQVLSPALLFYPERIRRNIREMVRIAGLPNRLRPHVKTYKCPEIVKMQMEAGITRFKCSTLAEAVMLGRSKAPDVLVAYPLAGPNQDALLHIIKKFPETTFSTLVDHPNQAAQWKSKLEEPLRVYIDLDVGMHRTGIKPELANKLVDLLVEEPFNLAGFHAYDGHIRDTDINQRIKSVEKSFRPAEQFMKEFTEPKEFITGGSITFPIHASYPGRELSPGTTLLWDRGYGESFLDLNFDIAATLLTRIISKPGDDLICLDLGYKAVASEMKDHPPVWFPQLHEAELAGHSEEHLVLKTSDANNLMPGDVLYGLPWHICPTVAMHEKAGIVNNHTVTEFWEIASRERIYSTESI
jgi:D-serine deaminase-like pyridoxal phosphate-dependent protein